MITLAVLAVLFVLALIAVLILGIGGAAFFAMFADVFIAVAIVYFIIRLFKRKKKKS